MDAEQDTNYASAISGSSAKPEYNYDEVKQESIELWIGYDDRIDVSNSSDLTGPMVDSSDLTGPMVDTSDLTGPMVDSSDLTGPMVDSSDLTGPTVDGSDLTGPMVDSFALTGPMDDNSETLDMSVSCFYCDNMPAPSVLSISDIKQEVSFDNDWIDPNNSDLNNRKQIDSGQKDHICSTCGKCFPKSGYLRKHMLTHYSEKPYKCNICDKRFGILRYLTLHKATHSIGKMRHSVVRKLECSTCHTLFANSSGLGQHVKMHTRVKKVHKCNICNKVFNRSHHLLQHQPVHSGEKSHQCSVCGVCLSRKSELTRHMSLHTGDTRFKCDICNMGFTRASHLRNHELNHNKHVCTVCQHRFTLLADLTKHMTAVHATAAASMPVPCKLLMSGIKQEVCWDSDPGTVFTAKAFDATPQNHTPDSDHNDWIVQTDHDLGTSDINIKQELEEVDHPSFIEKTFAEDDNFASNNCASNNQLETDNNPMYDNVYDISGLADPSDLIMLPDHMLTHSTERPYKCEFCVERFCDISDLTNHTLVHKGLRGHKHPKDNICSVCGNGFTTLKYLKIHLLSHSNEKSNKCDICDKCFVTASSLTLHKVRHSAVKKFECHTCHKYFVDPSQLAQHVLIHTGMKLHKCNICNTAFSRSAHLIQHQTVHSGEKKHQCSICGVCMTRKNEVDRHMLTHFGEKPFKCEFCNIRFTRSSYLSKHKRAKHEAAYDSASMPAPCEVSASMPAPCEVSMSDLQVVSLDSDHSDMIDQDNCDLGMFDINIKHEEDHPSFAEKTFAKDENFPASNSASESNNQFETNKSGNNNGDGISGVTDTGDLPQHDLVNTADSRPYECHICNKAFKRHQHLAQHQSVHTGEKKHGCSVCGVCLSRKGELTRHMLIHTRAKLYKCDICDMGFTRVPNLTAHKLTHNKHACATCGRLFNTVADLTKHMTAHDSGKEGHTCDICAKTFSRPCYLNQHKLIHSDERNHDCGTCGRLFRWASDMRRHMMTHTNDKPHKCEICERCFRRSTTLIKHRLTHRDKTTDVVQDLPSLEDSA